MSIVRVAEIFRTSGSKGKKKPSVMLCMGLVRVL